MNGTQIQTTAAPLIAFVAGILAGRGAFGLDAETWTLILGSLAGTIATIWGAIAARKAAIVTTVANMPEVKQVTLVPGAPGVEGLNQATPTNVRVQ